jgi:hypothetical protein
VGQPVKTNPNVSRSAAIPAKRWSLLAWEFASQTPLTKNTLFFIKSLLNKRGLSVLQSRLKWRKLAVRLAKPKAGAILGGTSRLWEPLF